MNKERSKCWKKNFFLYSFFFFCNVNLSFSLANKIWFDSLPFTSLIIAKKQWYVSKKKGYLIKETGREYESLVSRWATAFASKLLSRLLIQPRYYQMSNLTIFKSTIYKATVVNYICTNEFHSILFSNSA